MLKILKLIPYVGILIIAVGFIGGFGYMFVDNDDMTKIFISIIPIGFLVLFVGVVTNYLSGGE